MKFFASRWFLILPFVLAGIIMIGWYGVWRAGGDVMRREVASFVAAERARGVTISHDPVRLEGFPFLLRGRLDAVTYDTGTGLRLETDRLYLDALPYALDRLIVSLAGNQRLSAGGQAYLVETDNARASIENDTARGWRLNLESDGLVLARAGTASANRSDTALTGGSTGHTLLTIAPLADDPRTLETSLSVDRPALAFVTAGGAPATLAGDRLEGFAAASHIDRIGTPALWRAAGGALDLRTLSVQSGQSAFSLAGVVTLDAAGYPAGTLRTRIDQPQGLATALNEAGILTKDEAEALASGLNVAAAFGGGALSAPVELRAGRARVLGMGVGRLPQLADPSR